MTTIHADPLDRMRAIPLETVAIALGYRRDPTDRANRASTYGGKGLVSGHPLPMKGDRQCQKI